MFAFADWKNPVQSEHRSLLYLEIIKIPVESEH